MSSWKFTGSTLGLLVLFNIAQAGVSGEYRNKVADLTNIKNSPPQLLNLERAVINMPNSGRITITNTIEITDADNDQLTGAVIKFVDGTFQSAIVDRLSLKENVGNISSAWNPVEGVLTLQGTDTKENYEKALRSIEYTFIDFFLSGRPMVKKISITVKDGTNQSESVIRYVAVKNPADILSWISDFNKSLDEDGTLVFDQNDFQNNYAPDKAKFTGLDILTLPEHGSLIFNGNPITFNDILSNGSSFRIEIGNINKLMYKPSENYSGPDHFEWNSFDGKNFATTDAVVNITVTEVNDAPVITAPPEVNNAKEDTPSRLPNIEVNDVDDPQLQAELKVDHGVLSIEPNLINVLTFKTGDGTADKALQFTGTVEHINQALAALTYQPDNNFSGTDQLSIKITDRINGGNAATATANVQITVVPVNDAPVLAGIPATPFTYTENDGPVAIAPEITLTDEENNKIIAANITVQDGFQANEDKINFTPKSGISGTLDGNTLELNGVASLADYQQVIRSVTYENTSEKPTAANRVVSLQVKDEDDGISETKTLTITVKAVDDPPVLSAIETEKLNFVQFGDPVSVTNAVKISDLDDETVEKAIISFADNSYLKNEDVLSFKNTGKINGTWNVEEGILTLSGTAPLPDYQSALRNVFYNNKSETPHEKDRTISFQVSSHGTNSNVATRKVTIIVNERPTISSFNRQIEEDQRIRFRYEDFVKDGQYQDPDNFPKKDSLSRIAIRTLPQHGNLVAGKDTLTQTLLDAVSAGYEIAGNAIGQLLYIPEKDYNGSDQFIWNAFDGAQYAIENAAVDITITPVNDAPLVQNFEKEINEEDTLTFSVMDFTSHYTDAEGDILQKIVIRAVPTEGALILNGITIPANTEIEAANIPNLMYIPAENFSGTDSFSWSAFDESQVAEQSALVSITVHPVNDAPILRDFTKAIAENEVLNFLPEDFTNNYIDVENDPMAFVVIKSLPENGQLLLNGQVVDTGDQISTAQLSQFIYQPDSSLGGGRDAFTWNASDGTDPAPQDATLNIIVGVGVTDFHVFISEDELYTFRQEDFINNYGNPAGDLQAVRIDILPTNGTLYLNSTPVTAGQTIPRNNLGQLVYTPNQNYFGEDVISWSASDGTNYTDETAKIFVKIQAVNDAPEISAIENITIVAGESTGPVPFSISDVETEASSLILSAFSENKSLISDAQITLGGSGNNRSITLKTSEGQSGEAVITILVSDGEQQTQQSFILIIVPYFITLEAGEDIVNCNDQPFDITIQQVSGGIPPYSYSWSCSQDDCAIEGEPANSLTIQPATTTSYYVQVTDAHGIVSNQDTITVKVVDCSQVDLSIPTGFTPNGDGINDVWEIGKLSYVKSATVDIFDRFGQQIFHTEGYSVPWDGTSKEHPLPVGTYYYIINVENGLRVFKGSVTILR